MISLLVLILGFILLVFGASRFVSGSSAMAKKLGVPSLIIGLTVVAFGTSAPELAVSVSASLAGQNEIALGNVIGSNIFNLLFVAGASAMITTLIVAKELINRDWVATVFATIALLILMLIDSDISRLDALILLLGFAAIMFLQIKSALKSKNSDECEVEIKKESTTKIIFNIIIGLICIILGGQLSVQGASEIAKSFGLSETLIGLTIVAIGTSLPELVTSLVATKQGENSIAIGNVIGSNLFNVLFILGVSCFISPISVQITAIYDTVILLVVTIFMLILAKLNKLNRGYGILLVCFYISYTVWLIVR